MSLSMFVCPPISLSWLICRPVPVTVCFSVCLYLALSIYLGLYFFVWLCGWNRPSALLGGGQGGPGARSAEGQNGARSAEEYGGRAPGQNIYGWLWIVSCLKIDFLRLFGALGMLFQRPICLRTSISKTSLLGNSIC